jgi:hypothetical protein
VYFDSGMLVNGLVSVKCKTLVDDVEGNGWNGQQQVNTSSPQPHRPINTCSGPCCRPFKSEGWSNLSCVEGPRGIISHCMKQLLSKEHQVRSKSRGRGVQAEARGETGRILNARLKLSTTRRWATACILQRSRSVFSAVTYKQYQPPVAGLRRQND